MDSYLKKVQTGMELLEKNWKKEVEYLDDTQKEFACRLLEYIEHIVNEEKRQLFENMYSNDNGRQKYEDEVNCIWLCLDRDGMTYANLIGMAQLSIYNRNYPVFYAAISIIRYKLSDNQRMFYDEGVLIDFVEDMLLKLLGRNKVRPHYRKYITDIYVSECRDYYTNMYIGKGYKRVAFNSANDLNENFHRAASAQNMRKFILLCDDIVRHVETEESIYIWKMLYESLILDFLYEQHPWNNELSKSLLAVFIGIHDFYAGKSIVTYNEGTKGIVSGFIVFFKDFIASLSYDYRFRDKLGYPEICNFLLNLYHIFPYELILEFMNDISIRRLGAYQTNSDLEGFIMSLRTTERRECQLERSFQFVGAMVPQVYLYDEVDINDSLHYIDIRFGVYLPYGADVTDMTIGFEIYDQSGEKISVSFEDEKEFEYEYELPGLGPSDYQKVFSLRILQVYGAVGVKARIVRPEETSALFGDKNWQCGNKAEGRQLKDITLEELELSVRSYNVLKRASFNTLEDLSQQTIADMMKVRNMGRRSLEEIILKLLEYGVRLSTDGRENINESIYEVPARKFICKHCGSDDIDDEGYCNECGMQQ